MSRYRRLMPSAIVLAIALMAIAPITVHAVEIVELFIAQTVQDAPLFRDMLTNFMRENPDVRVQLIQSSWEEYSTKLITMMAAGLTPDVIWLVNGAGQDADFMRFNKPDLFLDLMPYVQASGYKLDSIVPSVLDSVRSDGALYGIPFEVSLYTTWYDKDMLDAAGVPYPTHDWTWDDMVEKAQRLTRRTADHPTPEVFGYAMGYPHLHPWEFIWQAGGDYFDASGTTATLDSPETMQGIQFALDLVESYGVSPNPLTQHSLPSGVTSAMRARGIWDWGVARREGRRYGAVASPAGPASQDIWVRTNVYVVSKDTENPDAAWRLVEYLTSPGKGLDTWAYQGGKVVPFQEYLDVGEYVYRVAVSPDEEAMFREILEATIASIPLGRPHRTSFNNRVTYERLRDEFFRPALNPVWNQQASLQAAMEQVTDVVNAVLK